MFSQKAPRRDAFALSRGGATVLGGFSSIPAVDADRFNKLAEEQQAKAVDSDNRKTPRFLWRRRSAG